MRFPVMQILRKSDAFSLADERPAEGGGQTLRRHELKSAHEEDRTMSAARKLLLLHALLMLISSRCINTKTVEPTPSPLVPVSPLSTDMRSVILKGQSHTERIELINPVNLTLECNWTGNHQNKPLNISAFWQKDGREIQDSRLTVALENERYNLKRLFSIISEETLGNYSCVFGNEAKVDFTLVAPHIAEKRDKPIVSYVGDTVVLTCKMEEAKPKPTSWNWYKDNGTDKEQILAAEERHRYEIDNDGRKTKLKVKNLTALDSGMYYCGAVYNISIPMSHMKLKVITFLEPLKPFLSIMVEVIVLVAVILLCERRQSKKKKAEEDNVYCYRTSRLNMRFYMTTRANKISWGLQRLSLVDFSRAVADDTPVVWVQSIFRAFLFRCNFKMCLHVLYRENRFSLEARLNKQFLFLF